MAEVSQAPTVMEPKGIGGWLILPVIGTILSALMAVYAAFQDAVVLLNSSVSILTAGAPCRKPRQGRIQHFID